MSPATTGAWVAAVLLYGAGDLVTTAWGLSHGAVESNPLPALVLGLAGMAGLIVLKAAVLSGCYLAYRRVPYREGIPAGLLVVGATVTLHNLVVIA